MARLAAGHDVWCLGRGSPGIEDGTLRWISHDLTRPTLPDDLPDTVDTVVYLAQFPDYRDFPGRAADIYQINTGSVFLLLEWARKAAVRRFIYASTGGLYGHGEEPFREDAPLPEPGGPLGFYFATKRAGELLCSQYANLLTTMSLRFFFVYGSGQAPQMLFPRLIDSIGNDREISLEGDAGPRMNPIHARDAARAIETCLDLNRSGPINIAGEEVVTLKGLCTRIGALADKPPRFARRPNSGTGDLVADISLMSTLLGPPQVGLTEGLAEMVPTTEPT